MEKYGIGTDASIPVHINNICERNYVQVYTFNTKFKFILVIFSCKFLSFSEMDISFLLKMQVQVGRKLVPTTLGITLIRGYQCIDPDICLPDIRSFIEHQITLVAKGQANHSRVVQHVLQQFKQKFSYFVQQVCELYFVLAKT